MWILFVALLYEESNDKNTFFLPIIHYEMFLQVFLIRSWCCETFFSQDRQPLVFALNFCLEEHHCRSLRDNGWSLALYDVMNLKTQQNGEVLLLSKTDVVRTIFVIMQ